NGVTALAGAALTTSAPLEIGGSQDSGELAIDEAAVFDKAVGWERIREHFVRGRAPVMESGEKLKATATDDGTVSEVEFLLDGKPFAKVTAPPYEAALPGPNDVDPAYDGTHAVTTRTTDNHGKTTTSSTANVVISNAPSDTRANIESSPLPDAVVWNPASGATQEEMGVDVPVFNTGDRPLKAADTDVRYRWVRPDGTTAATGDKPLSVDVNELSGEVTRISVPPPALLDGVQKAKHQLQLDLVDKRTGSVLSTKGNKPKDKPIEVERKTPIGLGLERFYHYEGEQVGGGMQHLVNLASGNSLLRFTPFDTPGRGLNTVLDLTYNSLEDKSRSPAGNNVSLAISGLTPLGMQLDPHPNKADEIAGKSNKYVEIVDADGTRHRFEGKAAADGTTYWEEPAGVHLYLRVYSTTDKTRKWALTRPDRVTFFFDDEGFPTSVEDRNGNRLTYKLEETPPGEDPGGPKKRITAVTDAGNQSFDVSYYSKAEAKKAHVRGKIKRITDHSGSPLDFEYYEDGNLRRLVQRGGTTNTGTPAQGVTVDDRAWVFTYTTSAGDGPALPTAAERSNPPEKVANQSTRLFSIRDPRGNETTFTYLGPGNGNDRWKIASRTDRANATTSYAYDPLNRVTTVTKPLSRVTKYAFDGDGKVTQITNAKNELVKVTWTGDRHVSKVTDPHLSGTLNPAAREFSYNDNGYLLSVKNQAGEQHCMTYQNVAVDGNDVVGKWKAGRTIEHVSQVRTKETPKGCATATPDNDFETVFDYDAKGNLVKVTDPEDKFETTEWRADGTISRIVDPKSHATSYNAYDVNGLPTQIVDAKSQTTRLSFDADGLLRWVQDPNHQNDSGTEYEFKTFHFYDAFHRPVRQSSPKSTRFDRKQLIWSGAEYDANDNPTATIQPYYGQAWSGAGARTRTRFDAMDRPDLVTMPDTSADPAGERMTMTYDAAGRLTRRTLPRGVQSAAADDFTDVFDYDPLDRVVTTKRYEVGSNGTITRTLQAHRCFETDGDVKSITFPRANQTTPNCDATGVPYRATFEYDPAHRQTKVTKAGQSDVFDYDLNGNVEFQVDRKNAKTELYYDERDLLVKKVQAHEWDKLTGQTTRPITTLYEYDAARNVSAEVSPRAFDAAGGVGPWDNKDYVKRHTYDELNRLSRTEQPSKAGEVKTYVHITYDANGNQLSISQPVTNPSSANVEDRENRTYFDPGWIHTSQQGSPTPVPPRQPTVDPVIRWDYTAEGWPISRAPDKPGGGTNEDKRTTWEYYVDGQVKAQHDRAGQITQYGYDADDNLTSMVVTRSTKPQEPVLTMNGTYDSMDRQTKVRQRKQGETNWKATTFAYDEHSNITQRFDDIEESDAGSQVKAGRRHDFVNYDQLDRLVEQIDYGADLQTTTQDDRQIRWTYNEVDLPLTRVQRERDMVAAGTPFSKDVQTNAWDYTGTNRRKKVETKNHAGTVIESHTIAYTATENGRSVYLNGNKATDDFTRKGPDAAMPCQSSSCSNTYGYDGRDRMTADARMRAGSTTTIDYKLSPAGNVEEQGSTPAGGSRTIQKSFTYSSNNQIQTGNVGGQSQRYHYKDGNLDCITTSTGSANDCSPAGTAGNQNLVEDYSIDAMDRMEGFRSYSGGTLQTQSTYTHDALDRLTEQTTTSGSTSNTTKSSFLGMSSAVTKDESTGSSGSRTRQYSYDANGQRVGMSDTRGAAAGQTKQYGFGHDADGNVSQVVNQSSGSQQGLPQASYGYSAYGDSEQATTRENDPVTGSATTDDNPLNAYRFESRRYDTASKSLDMGARRYSPTSAHFIQQDFYESAVSDLGLSQDPLTSNRYSFEGANPINFVEVDGHGLIDDIEEGAEDVKDAAEDGVNSVRNKARDTARSVRRRVSETASDAKRAVSDTAGDVADKARETADNVADKTSDVAGDVKEKASNVASDVREGAQSAGRGVKDGIGKASAVADKASNYLGKASGAIGGAAGAIEQGAKQAGGKVAKWTKGKITSKGLANGAAKVKGIAKKAGRFGTALGGLADFGSRVARGENVVRAGLHAGANTAAQGLVSFAGGMAGRGAGFVAGGLVGGAIGSIVPGAGTAAGAAAGAAIGQAVGGAVGAFAAGEAFGDEAEDLANDAADAVSDAIGV
ncbi:MAG TPA: RHS repeat-associated core domain-containing protein, partial [Frankiaceae bacterium]|nr:RHS repeat-associated core domain-containing protein [Frankiaceae bacterium]